MKEKVAKKLIQAECINKQNDLINNFKKREEEINSDASSQTETASQSENRGVSKIEILNAINAELSFAQEELNYLNSLDMEKECIQVEPGAVVATDKLTFFISISSEKIEIDGQIFFGISTKAPIYASMNGLKNGDKFQYNETKYVIEDLY